MTKSKLSRLILRNTPNFKDLLQLKIRNRPKHDSFTKILDLQKTATDYELRIVYLIFL